MKAPVLASAVLVIAAAGLAACASRPARDPSPPLAHRKPLANHRIAQLEFGNASFAICAEPACPKRTPKTIPSIARTTLSLPPTVASISASEPAPRRIPAVLKADSRPLDRATARSRQVRLRFPIGSAELDPGIRQEIDDALPFARKANRIVISGRTDAIGGQPANDRLALARAVSARDYLRARVPEIADAITLDAKGRCCFVADNDTAAGRAENRRVEITFHFPG